MDHRAQDEHSPCSCNVTRFLYITQKWYKSVATYKALAQYIACVRKLLTGAFFFQSPSQQEVIIDLKRRLETTNVIEFPRHRLRMISKLAEGAFGTVRNRLVHNIHTITPVFAKKERKKLFMHCKHGIHK